MCICRQYRSSTPIRRAVTTLVLWYLMQRGSNYCLVPSHPHPMGGPTSTNPPHVLVHTHSLLCDWSGALHFSPFTRHNSWALTWCTFSVSVHNHLDAANNSRKTILCYYMPAFQRNHNAGVTTALIQPNQHRPAGFKRFKPSTHLRGQSTSPMGMASCRDVTHGDSTTSPVQIHAHLYLALSC